MKRKWFIRVLKVLAGLVAVLAVAGWFWNESTKTALAAAQERCRAAGLPMTIDDIRPPPVPDADNAALVIAKLEPLLLGFQREEKFDGLAKLKDVHSAYLLDAAAAGQLATILESQSARQVMGMIDDATTRKGYDAKLELELGPYLTIQTTSAFTSAADLLCWQARLSASRGQIDEACAAIWKLTLVAELPAREPTLISQLVRATLWQKAMQELEKLVAAFPLPTDWSEKFSSRLARLDVIPDLARCFDGERIGMGGFVFPRLMMAKNLEEFRGSGKSSDPETLDNDLRLLHYLPVPLLRAEYADYIDRLRKMRVAMGDTALSYQQKQMVVWQNRGGIPKHHLVSQFIVPSFGSVVAVPYQAQAHAVVTQVGLALERYRQAKGAYPATLVEFVPEYMRALPVDIFTGKPLIYRTEPGGAVVYSVGPNLRDDGGVKDSESGKDDEGWSAGTAAVRKFAPQPAPPEPEPAKE